MYEHNPALTRTPMYSKEKTQLQNEQVALRDEQFWYDDGSVVLHVGTKLFRVHRSILAAHSEIFADMFRMPQPANQPLLEGCPIVTLTDCVTDFEDLLKALYHPFYFDSLPNYSALADTLDFVSGILSLSTKYFILQFRERSISLLKRIIPTTLDAYDSKFESMFFSEDPNVIARAIGLAHKNNLPEFLPSLYYVAACRISPGRMLDRNSINLSWEERTVCLVGREMLRMLEKLISYRFLYDFRPPPSCKSLLCAKSTRPLHQWRVVENRDSPAPLTPFHKWDELDVCLKCILHIREQHTAGREAVWARLPSAFNMSSWDVLAKMQ
ncbi:hypothetical protein BDZ94DRAFT_1193882, partial [Collybia nuda]